MRKEVLYIRGSVLTADIVTAIDPLLSPELLAKLDEELKGKESERIDFDDVEVFADAALDAVEAADMLPEPESLSDELNQGDVQDLAAAIRRGDQHEAEVLLDRIFASDTTATEWVQRGRYSGKARALPVERKKAA